MSFLTTAARCSTWLHTSSETGRCGLKAPLGGFAILITFSCLAILRLLFELQAIVIRTHRIRKQVEKRVCHLLARRAVIIVDLKRLHNCVWNACVLKDATVCFVLKAGNYRAF